MIGSLKRAILPSGKSFRRIRFGPAAGMVMKIDLQHELRLLFGLYERELVPHYRALLKSGMKSFDIGGRDGYSALMINSLTRAEVISFDCEQFAIDEMQAVFDRNRLPIRATKAFVGKTTALGSVTVDKAAEEYFRPDFLKIDVEGAEVDVLLGAQKTLSEVKPAAIIEVHGQSEEKECLAILRTAGYTPLIVDQVTFLREHRPLPHNRWLVCAR